MDISSQLDKLLDRSGKVNSGVNSFPITPRKKIFKKYAVSNFRGGIGKTTLTFNVSYEISKQKKLLILDTCSQKNTTHAFLGDFANSQYDLYKQLIAELTNTQGIQPNDLCLNVTNFRQAFLGNKAVYLVPGSSELFLFPSLLYSQLAQYTQLSSAKEEASKRVLMAIERIIEEVTPVANQDLTIIDTSPFFGGATHLSWCAADALIVPVRVDQNSVDAFKLTLQMLREQSMDFQKFNRQAGLDRTPVVHAVAMTHCGWNRQIANTPDSTTRFFIKSALEVANEFSDLFSADDVSDCFYLLDDFHSAGRISGNQRIPISNLNAMEKYVVDGQRMAVNPSVDRYKRQIANLAMSLI